MRLKNCRRRSGSIGIGVLAGLAIIAVTLVSDPPDVGAAVSPTAPWQAMTTPGLFGPHEELVDVSCASVTFCIAVGGTTQIATSASAAVAEVWKGSGSWKNMSLPMPKFEKGATHETSFTGVSCTSPTYCVAVGNGTATWLAEVWNGARWSLTPAPTSTVDFSSISCVATNCVAVGSGGQTGIWNGSTWTIESTNLPDGLNAISCFSSEQCLAVGLSLGGDLSLGEYFDDGTWTDTHPPQNPEQFHFDNLEGVSCPPAATSASCMVVGFADETLTTPPLAETWDQTTGSWTALSPLSSSTRPEFQSVSCPSIASCVAVGPTTEAFNGSTWTLMDTSNLVSGSNPYALFSVSCPSATFCVAVGSKQVPILGTRSAAADWGTP